jgi:hypothetical protein
VTWVPALLVALSLVAISRYRLDAELRAAASPVDVDLPPRAT